MSSFDFWLVLILHVIYVSDILLHEKYISYVKSMWLNKYVDMKYEILRMKMRPKQMDYEEQLKELEKGNDYLSEVIDN